MSLLQFIPYYLWYFAINHSNVSDMMVISNSSSIFTYILTIIILKEQISITKLLGIALSFTGVIYMSLWNSEEIVEEIIQDEIELNKFNDTLLGDLSFSNLYDKYENLTLRRRDIDLNGLNEEFRDDIDTLYKQRIVANILAVFGSFFFGLSDVIFTKYVQIYKPRAHVSRGRGNTQIIFDRFSIRERKLQILMMVSGLIGLISLFMFWPAIPILNKLGIEPFEIPSFSVGLELFFISLLGFVYNYCYNYGSTLSGTVTFTCGLMVSLPITILSDYFINHNPIRQSDIISSLLIIVGEFIMIGSNRGDIISNLKLVTSYLIIGLRKAYKIIIYPLPWKDQLDIDTENGIFCCCKIYVRKYYFKNKINSLTRSRSNHLIDVSKMKMGGDMIPNLVRVKTSLFKSNSTLYEPISMEEIHHISDNDESINGSSSNDHLYSSSSTIAINIE
jgi:drug/metabolite transporter (DMT)-like permease